MRSGPRVLHPQPGSYFPQEPDNKFVGDSDKPVSEAYLKTQHADLTRLLTQIIERMGEKSMPFDSYRPQSIGGELLSSLNVPSDFAQQEVQSVIVTGPTAGFGSFGGHAAVATPAANSVIAGSTVVTYSGLYTVNWTVGIEVAAATTADNFSINFGGVAQLQSENALAIGDYPQQPIVLYIPAGNTVVVRNLLAETTATYSATVSVEPYQGSIPFSLSLGDRNWNLALPNTGLFAFRVKPGIWLKQEDNKQLNSPIAANWAVELTGYRSALA